MDIRNYSTGQYKAVAIQIIKDVIDHSKHNNITDFSLVDNYIEQSLDLLFSLKSAIHENNRVWDENEKLSILYNDYNWDDGLKPWIEDTSKIDITGLNEIIGKYLSYEWFSSPTFEWYLINPYLRYYVKRNRKEFLFSSSVGSARSWAACFSTEFKHYLTIFIILKCFGIIINWVLPIFLIIIAFIKGWLNTSLILIIMALASIIFSIITYPKKGKLQKNQMKTLTDLIELKRLISQKLWSPSFVMDKVKTLNQTFLMPELIPLVSKMIKRDSKVFNAI